jgi:hypothetical protein
MFDYERGGMNATTPPTAPHPRPAASPVIVAYQVTPPPRRRGFPPAVLRAVAHHQQRRLIAQAPRTLRDCPALPGARSTGSLHPLAVDITHGRLAALPSPAALPPLPASCCDTGWIVDHEQPWNTHHATRRRAWTADLGAGEGPPGVWLRARHRLRNQPRRQHRTNRATPTPVPGWNDGSHHSPPTP